MVKFIISSYHGETSRYTREYNTYGEREDLLYPIKMNDSFLGKPQQDANLATYVIKFKEFKGPNVKIEKNGSKVRFLNHSSLYHVKYMLALGRPLFATPGAPGAGQGGHF